MNETKMIARVTRYELVVSWILFHNNENKWFFFNCCCSPIVLVDADQAFLKSPSTLCRVFFSYRVFFLSFDDCHLSYSFETRLSLESRQGLAFPLFFHPFKDIFRYFYRKQFVRIDAGLSYFFQHFSLLFFSLSIPCYFDLKQCLWTDWEGQVTKWEEYLLHGV